MLLVIVKITLICLCVSGALSQPQQRNQAYETFDEVNDDAETIEAAANNAGTRNLDEKRLPVLRLIVPSDHHLVGTNNLAERIQLPYYDYERHRLPGVRNLAEKSLPESVVGFRSTNFDARHRDPESELKKVVGIL